MRDFTPFTPDPVQNPSGTLNTYGINPDEQLMVYNDTIYGLRCEFADGTWDVIPAAWNKDFIKSFPMGYVKWSIYNQMSVNPADYPQTEVYGILYEQGEHVPSVNQSMQRAFNITGGKVSTTSTASIDNEGNASGSAFLKSVLSGQTNPSVLFTNDGAGYIAQLIASVLVTVFQISDTDPVVALGAVSHLVEILGTLTSNGLITANAGIDTTTLDATGKVTASGGLGVAGGLTVDTLTSSGLATLNAIADVLVNSGKMGVAASGDTIDASSTTARYDKIRAAGDWYLQIPGGTTRLHVSETLVDTTGVGGLTGNFMFPDGSKFSGMHTWSASSGSTTGVTVSHYCNKAPQDSLAVPNSGASYGSATCGIGNVTSTTLLVTQGASLSGTWGLSITYN